MNDNGKVLGFWMCTALIIGNVIGMGIFMLPASLAPYGFNAFIGWGITLIGCVFIAQVFANFARIFPNEDGPYGYTRRVFGNGVAFFVMWCYWVSVWITNATLSVGVVGYLSALFPVLTLRPWIAPCAALGLVWFFVIVSLFGARTSGRVQVLTVILKLLPMVAVLVLGMFVLSTDAPAFVAHLPSTPLSWEASAAAGTIALFAMLGVESATIPAGKVQDPGRTIPRATMFATVPTACIYIGVSAVPLLLMPQSQLMLSNAPFVDLFKLYLNADSGHWVAIFVVISGVGALNGWTMMVGEMTASFAHHGVFPAWLQQRNRRGVPTAALLLCAVLTSGMIIMNYSRSLAQGFTFLSVMVTAASLPLYLIAGIGLIKLWRKGEVIKRNKTTAWFLISAFLAALYTVWAAYGIGQESLLWGLALGAISLPIYFGRRFLQSRLPKVAVVESNLHD